MDRRKRLLDFHEEATLVMLNKVALQNKAKVFAKIRIADALEITSSGLSDIEYGYALKAHFDFVVANTVNSALFAVEFDGLSHEHNATVIANDAKKNSICKKLGMPFLRINADFLTRKIRRFTLLSWLTELWFLNEAFEQAQKEGTIPDDEPFCYFAILAESLTDKITFPYDLSLPSRAFLNKCCEQERCKDFTPAVHIANDVNGYTFGVALIRLNEENVVVGRANCRSFMFQPVSAQELCQELATIEACEKMKAYLSGKYRPVKMAEAISQISNLEKLAKDNGAHYSKQGVVWQ